jgi:hypothetical protein
MHGLFRLSPGSLRQETETPIELKEDYRNTVLHWVLLWLPYSAFRSCCIHAIFKYFFPIRSKMYYHYVLLGVTAGLLIIFGRTDAPYCRCRPWETCWPTDTEWATFNTSIDGGLVQLKPVGYVCHEPTFNGSICDTLSSLSRNSAWRASQPGSSLRFHPSLLAEVVRIQQVLLQVLYKTGFGRVGRLRIRLVW